MMRTILLTIVLLSCSIYVSCATGDPDRKRRDRQRNCFFLVDIHDPEEFHSLAQNVSDEHFNGVQSVMLVYDIPADQLYFINSKQYATHHTFCTENLAYGDSEERFLACNRAHCATQQYWLASLEYFAQANTYAISFSTGSLPDFQDIRIVYQSVVSHSFLENNVGVLINSVHLNWLASAGEISVPCVYPSRVYKEQYYRPICQGECVGVLHRVNAADLRHEDILPTDILLLDEPPVSLPLCVGVIITKDPATFSTFNMQVRNNRTISAMDRRSNNSLYEFFDGKPVRLVVSDDSLHIEISDMKAVDAYRDLYLQKHKGEFLPVGNSTGIIPLANCILENLTDIGIPAALLAEVQNVRNEPCEALVIPMSYYECHISQPEVQEVIGLLDSLQIGAQDVDSLSVILDEIKQAIMDAPVDPALIKELLGKLRASPSGYALRLSTNEQCRIELPQQQLCDIEYGECEMETAIQMAWASVWDVGRVIEIQQRGMNMRQAGVALIVAPEHDVAAGGIIYATSPGNGGRPRCMINYWASCENIMLRDGGEDCDQLICEPFGENGLSVNDVSNTRYNGLITPGQVNTLYFLLDSAIIHFNTSGGGISDHPDLSMEFSVDKDGQVYINGVMISGDFFDDSAGRMAKR